MHGLGPNQSGTQKANDCYTKYLTKTQKHWPTQNANGSYRKSFSFKVFISFLKQLRLGRTQKANDSYRKSQAGVTKTQNAWPRPKPERDTKRKRQLHKISHQKAKAQAHTKTQTGVDKNAKFMAQAKKAKCRYTTKTQMGDEAFAVNDVGRRGAYDECSWTWEGGGERSEQQRRNDEEPR